jgi:hypothetical protein
MQAYVYQASLEYQSSVEMLESIRETVQRLRAENPELRRYELADMGLKRAKDVVNVTLFFRPSVS